jgi:hypothetical protein
MRSAHGAKERATIASPRASGPDPASASVTNSLSGPPSPRLWSGHQQGCEWTDRGRRALCEIDAHRLLLIAPAVYRRVVRAPAALLHQAEQSISCRRRKRLLVNQAIQRKTNSESQNHKQQYCIDVHVVPRCLSSLAEAAGWLGLRPT